MIRTIAIALLVGVMPALARPFAKSSCARIIKANSASSTGLALGTKEVGFIAAMRPDIRRPG